MPTVPTTVDVRLVRQKRPSASVYVLEAEAFVLPTGTISTTRNVAHRASTILQTDT